MDPKQQLIKQLKKDYFNDYCIFIDSVVMGFKYWIYSNKEIALKEFNRINNNSDMLKPCTIELINLW